MSSPQRKLGSVETSASQRVGTPAFVGVTDYGYMAKGGYTYILTNKPCGVLYIGVTSDIAARMMQHREGKGSAFARRYGLNRLVLVEHHDAIEDAIAREKAMKAWKRAWKIELIETTNPAWKDLFEEIN